MFDFVNKMSVWDQTFFYLAFGATVFFVGQVILTFVGFDDDSDIDMEGDSDTDSYQSFQLFTVKNMIAMLVGFGWGGLAMHLEVGLGKSVSLLIAVIIGVGFALLQSSLMFLMYKLHAPNTESTMPAEGTFAGVYLNIPSGGIGKIQVDVNGKSCIINATADEDIRTGEFAVVKGIANGCVVVEKVKSKKQKTK